MPTTTPMTNPPSDQEPVAAALPQFQSREPGTDPAPPPPGEEPTPSQHQTLPPPRPSLAEDRPSTTATTPSSTAFSEADVKDAIGDLAGGVFLAGGAILNRMEQRRSRIPTERWKPTATEVQAFGEAAEKIAVDRLPGELMEGDGAQALVVGAVLVGYAVRNLVGVDASGMVPAGQGAPPQMAAPAPAPPPRAPAAAPQPPIQPQPAPAPAPASVSQAQPTQGVETTAKAEPTPPSILEMTL